LIFFVALHHVVAPGGRGAIRFALQVAVDGVVPDDNAARILEDLHAAAYLIPRGA
jgi:hypothetical protein